MHSITGRLSVDPVSGVIADFSLIDCVAGTALGIGIWYANMVLTPAYDAFLQKNSTVVPTAIIPLCLGLVFIHPEPVDDCPCFEDAIAFVAVATGIALGRWYNIHLDYRAVTTSGVFAFEKDSLSSMGIWIACAMTKLTLGISLILIWRVVAKRALHIILPPLFTLFRPIIDLPRRHYQRATWVSYSRHAL